MWWKYFDGIPQQLVGSNILRDIRNDNLLLDLSLFDYLNCRYLFFYLLYLFCCYVLHY